ASSSPDGDVVVDVDTYLQRAYAAGEMDVARAQLDRSLTSDDVVRLSQSAARLSTDLPALTTRLSAAEMSRGLALYESGDAALTELVVDVRRLDSRPPESNG